jgi:acetyl esterase
MVAQDGRMPLDPFFVERLRVHRRYLIGQAIDRARKRIALLWPFDRESPGSVQAVATTARPSSARAQHRRAAFAWDRNELDSVGTPGPDVPITEHNLVAEGVPAFRVRVYLPNSAAPFPAVLAFFGGAFRIGGIDYPTTDAAYRRRAVDAGVAIVAVDYALAPEHRYPTQTEQAHAALVWLFDNAVKLNIDPDRIGVAGVSAGANLAAAVTLMNRDRSRLAIRIQVLEVPVVDLTGRHLDFRATRALGIPTPIARRELRSIARTYLPHPTDAGAAYASPLRARSHVDLPPAVILTAEYDPLRGDGAAYAAALRSAGVEASAVQYLGVTHDIGIFTGVLDSARRWHDDVVTALRRLHG